MCGVFGIRAPERDVARITYFGLHALQHRGQESAGIAVSEQGRLTALRDLGLVTQVFDEQSLRALQGEVAIGHTRYSTTGAASWANAQPLLHHGRVRTVAVGHNGNLINAAELREEAGVRLSSSSDSEVIAAMIANDERPLEEAIAAAMSRLEGAATVVGLADGTLFAFRDRYGFRPLVTGRLGDDVVVASETCALDLVGATFEREVHPGELVLADQDGVRFIQALPEAAPGALCIFEFFYLARPDTRLAGVEVHAARVRMGEQLAEESPVEADLVMPIPDSGTPAAIGFSRATGIAFSEGLIKNRYIHRTFIQPEQGLRDQGVRLKFNPLAEVAGKRLVVVDDSIVRGSTTRQIVQMLFDAGAAEVHIRVSSPPVISPCYYGIDLATTDEMIAAHATVEEVREAIGATSLAYLSLDGLQAATMRPESTLCRACLTKEYLRGFRPMPKSFVSSLLAPRRRSSEQTTRTRLAVGAVALLAITGLAAGCGGAKEPFYTPDQVRTAFEAEGISIFDRNQPIPRFSPIPARAPSAPVAEPVVEPLTAMLKGVRAAVLGSTTRKSTRATTLLGFQLTVFIYPREKDARRKAADLADTLGALQILNRVNLGYKRKGNVVVSYRAYRYRYQRGVPGFPDAQQRIQAYDGEKSGSVAAALARLP